MFNKKNEVKSFERNFKVMETTLRSKIMSLKSHFHLHIKAYLLLALIGFGIMAGEALAFDLDAAGKGITDPIKALINDYWPAGVFAMASSGAIMAQGDMRTRAIGFGAGALLAGVIMTGVKLGLGT